MCVCVCVCVCVCDRATCIPILLHCTHASSVSPMLSMHSPRQPLDCSSSSLDIRSEENRS